MWISRKTVRGQWSAVTGGHGTAARRAALRRSSSPRLLSTVFCLLTAWLLHSRVSPAAISARYEVKEIKPHVFIWVPDDVLYLVGDPQFGRAGTAGFIVTGEGVVVVNTTNNPFNAREMLYEIRQRT